MIVISIFSGKCDLADFIAGMGGWFDKSGNPVTFGQENVSVYYSDFCRDFEAFKKLTNGALHQYIKLNKQDAPLSVEIHFDNMLDLIPYLPYLIITNVFSEDKQMVFISNESYAETKYKELLKHGCNGSMINHYRKALSDFYREVCQNYVLYNIESRTIQESVDKANLVKDTNGDYLFKSKFKIDYNHTPKFVFVNGDIKPRWGNVKVMDDTTLSISACDVNEYLAEDIASNNLKIEYVMYPADGFPIHLM